MKNKSALAIVGGIGPLASSEFVRLITEPQDEIQLNSYNCCPNSSEIR